MLKGKKLVLIIAAMLVVAGLVFAGIGFAIVGFSPKKLNTVEYKTKTTTINEDVLEITANVKAENIIFKPTNDSAVSVEVNVSTNTEVEVNASNGKLEIDVVEEKVSFGVNFNDVDYNIIVLLPQKAYNSIEVVSTSGEVEVATNVSAADVSIKTNSGEIKFCGNAVNLTANATSGEVSVENTTLQNNMIITTTSGEVELEDCDASYIEIKTTSGEVSGKLLSSKKYETKTDSGNVEVPQTNAKAICKITTSSGDIEFEQ